MPSRLIGIDRDGQVTHWNTAAQEKTNIHYNDALGKHLNTLINEPDIKQSLIESAIDKKKTKKLEAIQEGHGNRATFKDITIYPLTHIDSDGAVVRIDDVTTRVHLESMIIQNEKMASLGELAAGVAHEINNPLGTILQSIQNIHRRLSTELPANQATAETLETDLNDIYAYLEQRKILSFLDNIKDAGERAAAIVTNMLEFSRTHTFKHAPIQLNELLNRSIELAVSSSSLSQEYENIDFIIERHFPRECPVFYGSSAELQQVFLNIINNAYQAFSEHHLSNSIDEGITAETRFNITVSLSFGNEKARICIEDNGPGLDDWTQRHIFDPLFTTKETKKGTGLGLSVSYFIITEHHQGSISVDSEVGTGTKFIITMPLKQ